MVAGHVWTAVGRCATDGKQHISGKFQVKFWKNLIFVQMCIIMNQGQMEK